MPREDEKAIIGGLFALGAALEEAGPEVVFVNEYEERPESVPEPEAPSPARLAMVRVLAATPACTHQGSTTRH